MKKLSVKHHIGIINNSSQSKCEINVEFITKPVYTNRIHDIIGLV